MKKIFSILLIIIALIGLLFVISRLLNKAPSNDMDPNAQAVQILEDGGCLSCHSAYPKLPFYANLPIIGPQIRHEAEEALKQIDLTQTLEQLKAHQPIEEVPLTKIEKAVTDGTMPPHSYKLIHWKSPVNNAKTAQMLEWARKHRAQYYFSKLSAIEFANEPIRPVPDSLETNPHKVYLGYLLFHDTRLSANNTISCASCHDLATAGVDNEPVSDGINDQKGGVNAPTVFNSVFNRTQFWDGRAVTLAEQAAGPPLNPVEMGCSSFDQIVEILTADKAFAKEFEKIYPEGISQESITDAIAEYEKTLITPNAPFDRYLKGETDALTQEQIQGYNLFKEYECATCHVGVNLGGQSFERMGLAFDYFAERGDTLTIEDNGRYKETQKELDKHRFKVPGLRNVALTEPYFHDATRTTLEEAIESMAYYQLGLSLPSDQTKAITLFLQSLTGTYQGRQLTNKNLTAE